MSTFIKAAECWLPSADGTMLEFGGGLYGPGARMASVSREMCFGRGEGLPGRAWADAAPVVLHGFAGSYFRRIEAAQADGLTCGIAWPLFRGDTLVAVVVFFCGDDEDHVGAIEVWGNPGGGSKDLSLVDGHYGRTGDTFEYISRRTTFRPGTGLPGLAWQRGQPVFFDDLGRGAGFLRADGARKVGINRGLAVPGSTPGDASYVLTFLSALGTPIARRVELWSPDAANTAMVRTAGFCEAAGALTESVHVPRGEGAVGRCLATGLPQVVQDLAAEPVAIDTSAGIRRAIVTPVLQEGNLRAAVALYF